MVDSNDICSQPFNLIWDTEEQVRSIFYSVILQKH